MIGVMGQRPCAPQRMRDHTEIHVGVLEPVAFEEGPDKPCKRFALVFRVVERDRRDAQQDQRAALNRRGNRVEFDRLLFVRR